MSKTSAGIRTIALRIAGTKQAKEELEDLGEDVDDFVVRTESKTDSIVKAYTAVASNNYKGISVLDSNGNNRAAYDILLDIAKIYEEIQEEDKKNGTNRIQGLVEELAGKNRSNILSSILQNPQLLEEAYEASKHSEGIGQRELDIYLDSINSKLNTLHNHLQELAHVTIDSEWIKSMISLGSGAVKVITTMTKGFGGLSTIIGTIAGLVAQKNGFGLLWNVDKNGNNMGGIIKRFRVMKQTLKEQRTEIQNWVNANGGDKTLGDLLNERATGVTFGGQLSTPALGMDKKFQDWLKTQDEAIAKTKTLTQLQADYFKSLSVGQKAVSKISGAFKGFVSTIGSMLVSMAAVALVSKIVEWGVNFYNENFNDSYKIQKGKEAAQKASDVREESTKITKIYDTSEEKYNKLRQGVVMDRNVIKNISLTNEEYEEFLQLNKDLAEQLPNAITGFTESGVALVDLGTNAEEAAKKLREMYRAAMGENAEDVADEMPTIITGITTENDNLKSEITDLENELKTYNEYKDILNEINSDLNLKDYSFKLENADELSRSIAFGNETKQGMLLELLNNSGIGMGTGYNDSGEAMGQFTIQTQDQLDDLKANIDRELTKTSRSITSVTNKISGKRSQMTSNWIKNYVPNLLEIFRNGYEYQSLSDELEQTMGDSVENILMNLDYNKMYDKWSTGLAGGLERGNFSQYILDDIFGEIGSAIESDEQLAIDVGKLFNFELTDMTNEEQIKFLEDVMQRLFPDDLELQRTVLVGLNYAYYDENGKFHYTATQERDRLHELLAGPDSIYYDEEGKKHHKDNGISNWDKEQELEQKQYRAILNAYDQGKITMNDQGDLVFNDKIIESFERLIELIPEFNKAVETIPEGTLADVLNNEEFSKAKEGAEKNITAIQTALDKLKETGKLTGDDLKTLWAEVPELAEKYGEGITETNLADALVEETQKVAGAFDEAAALIDLTDEGKAAGVAWKDAYMEGIIGNTVSEQKAKDTLFNFFVTSDNLEQAKQQGMHVVDIINTLKEKYEEDVPWDVVISLLADPSMAELTTDEFIEETDKKVATVKIDADLEDAKIKLDQFVEGETAKISLQQAYISSKEARPNTSLEQAARAGVDLNRTKYGNIDFNNRQEIIWNRETLGQNKNVLKQWGMYSPADMLGTVSNVIGSSNNYGGVEIAFSPMLQTENGAVLLSPKTVDKYISGLIDEAKANNPDNWMGDLLALDAKGVESDGLLIKNIIADIGDTAKQTGEAMRYAGDAFANRITESDYAPIIQSQKKIADANYEYYEKLNDKYNSIANDENVDDTEKHNALKETNEAYTTYLNSLSDLEATRKEAREADLKYFNTVLDSYKAFGDELSSERTRIQDNGRIISGDLANQIAENNRKQIEEQEAIIAENERLYQKFGDTTYLQNITAAKTAIDEIRNSGTTAQDIVSESYIIKLGNKLTELEEKAAAINDDITLREGENLKPTLGQYAKLISNGKMQIQNLQAQNRQLGKQQNELRNNSKRWNEIRQKIAANNSAIKTMNGNINKWKSSLKSLGGDLGASLLSSLQQAFDESVSPTGLQYTSMKQLAQEFEGIEGFDFADIFYNTSQGVKLNARATDRVVDAKYNVVMDEFKRKTEAQIKVLDDLKEQYKSVEGVEKETVQNRIDVEQEYLDSLYNQISQYQAFYSESQKMFTGYGEWVRAQKTDNAGDTYKELLSYLETQEDDWNKGLVGTDDFKAFSAIGDRWGRDWRYDTNRTRYINYLTEDAKGVENFLNDLVRNNLATKTGTATYNLGDIVNTNDLADIMGMSPEFMDYMFGRLKDYGFTIDYVKNQVDGEMKIQEAVVRTGELIKLRNEAIKDGAPQDVVDDFNNQIAEMNNSLLDLRKNTADVMSREGKITSDDIKEVMNTIDAYRAYYDAAQSDQERNTWRQMMENEAESIGLKLNADLTVTVPDEYEGWEQYCGNVGGILEENVQDALDNLDYKKAADVTKEDIGNVLDRQLESYGGDPAKTSAIAKIANAWEDNGEKIQEQLEWLKYAAPEALKSINLDDGVYTEGMKNEEIALDQLKNIFGLTADEAKHLIPLLEQLGLIGGLAGTEIAEGAEQAAGGIYDIVNQGGTLDLNYKAVDEYLKNRPGEAMQMSSEDFYWDIPNLTDDELQAKIGLVWELRDAISKDLESGIVIDGQQETLEFLDELESRLKDENMLRLDIGKILDATQMSPDEFINLDYGTRQQILSGAIQQLREEGAESEGIVLPISPEIDDELMNQAIKEAESRSIEMKIQTTISEDSMMSLEKLAGMSDEDLKVALGIDDTEIEEARKQLKEDMESGYDMKISINESSIDAIGKAVSDALTGELNITNIDQVKESVSEVRDILDDVAKERKLEFDGSSISRNVQDLMQSSPFLSFAALDDSQIQQAKQETSAGTTMQIAANVTGQTEIEQLREAIDTLYGKTVSVREYGAENAKEKVDQLFDAISNLENVNPKIITVGVDNSIYSSIIAVSTLRNEIDKLESKEIEITTKYTTINETVNVESGGDLVAEAAGTFSPFAAYAKGTFDANGRVAKSGSAYNVINYMDAKAAGDVALNQNTDALVNELGTEGIVRDGKFMLVPGGPHIEHLKKGDIVFNHEQVKDLLSHGKTANNARVVGGQAAFARGTLNGIPAFANGKNNAEIDGNNNRIIYVDSVTNLYGAPNNGGSLNGHGTLYTGGVEGAYHAPDDNNNNDNDNDNGGNDGGGDDTPELEDGSKSYSEEVIDYVEIRLKYFADATQRVAEKITDFLKYELNGYKKKGDLIRNQITGIQNEINANTRAAIKYAEYAEDNARQFAYTDEDGNRQTVDITQWFDLNALREGYYDLSTYETTTAYQKAMVEGARQYMEYMQKAVDSNDAIQKLSNTMRELYSNIINLPTQKLSDTLEILEEKLNVITASKGAAAFGASGIAAAQRYLNMASGGAIDRLRYARQIEQDAERGRANSKAQGKVDKASRKVNNAQQSITDSKAYSKLSNKDKNALNSLLSEGKAIDISNIVDQSLKRAVKKNKSLQKLIKAYNNALKKQDKAESALSREQENYANQMGQAESIRQESNTHISSGAQTIANADYAVVKSWQIQNALLDDELDNKIKEIDKTKTALDEARANTQQLIATRDARSSQLEQNASVITGSSGFNDLSMSTFASQVIEDAIKNKTVIDLNQLGWVPESLREAIAQWNTAAADFNEVNNAIEESEQLEESLLNKLNSTALEVAELEQKNIQEKFNNIKAYYDAIVSLNDLIAAAESKTRQSYARHEAADYGPNSLQDTSIDEEIERQEDTRKQRLEEADEKEALLTQLIAEGKIIEGDVTHKQYLAEIQTAKNQAIEAGLAIDALYDEKFNNIESMYNALNSLIKLAADMEAKNREEWKMHKVVNSGIGSETDASIDAEIAHQRELGENDRKAAQAIYAEIDRQIASGELREGSTKYYELLTKAQQLESDEQDTRLAIDRLLHAKIEAIEAMYNSLNSLIRAMADMEAKNREEWQRHGVVGAGVGSYTDHSIDMEISYQRELGRNAQQEAIDRQAEIDQMIANGELTVGSADYYTFLAGVREAQSREQDARLAIDRLYQEKLDNIQATYDSLYNLIKLAAEAEQNNRELWTRHGAMGLGEGSYAYASLDREIGDQEQIRATRIEQADEMEVELQRQVQNGNISVNSQDYFNAIAEIEQARAEADQASIAIDKLFEEKLNLIQQQYQSLNSLIKVAADMESKNRQAWERHGVMDAGRGSDTEASINREISAQREIERMKREEAKKLQEELDDQVRRGAIDTNSQQYLDWMARIRQAQSEAMDASLSVDSLYDEKFNNIKDLYDSLTSLIESAADMEEKGRDLWKELGSTHSTTDKNRLYSGITYDTRNGKTSIQRGSNVDNMQKSYQKQIDQTNKMIQMRQEQARKLREEFNAQVNSGDLVAGSQKYNDYIQEINNADMAVQDLTISLDQLYDAMVEEVYLKPIEQLIDDIKDLRENITAIAGMISGEAMYTEEGLFSGLGLVKYNADVEEYKSLFNEMRAIQTERMTLTNLFESGQYQQSMDEYEAKLRELEDQERSVMTSLSSSRQQIIQDVTDRYQAELKYINKLIDARKEEINKKKELYDYDKKLRKSNKEIQLIEQQIRALNGLTDAESKAQKARLEAQRQELQEELDDTVQNHIVELRVDGLSDISEKLQENYDTFVKDLAIDMDKSANLVSDSANNLSTSINATNLTLQRFIESFGVDWANSVLNNNETISLDSNKIVVAETEPSSGTIQSGSRMAGIESNPAYTQRSNSSSGSGISRELQEDINNAKAAEEAYKKAISDAWLNTYSTQNSAEEIRDSYRRYQDLIHNGGEASPQYSYWDDVVDSLYNVINDYEEGGLIAEDDLVYEAIDELGDDVEEWLIDNYNTYDLGDIIEEDLLDTVEQLIDNYLTYDLGAIIEEDLLDSSGYASGTTHARGGLSRVFEEGPETIVTDHGIYIPLNPGDGVVPADMTRNLMAMAKNGTLPMRAPEINIPDISLGSTSQTITYNYDALIKVEGNVDAGVVDQIKEIAQGLTSDNGFKQAMYKYTAKQMAKDMRKAGY